MKKPRDIQLASMSRFAVFKEAKRLYFIKQNKDGSEYFISLKSNNVKKLSEKLLKMHEYLEQLK